MKVCIYCMTDVIGFVCHKCDEYDGVMTSAEFIEDMGYDYFEGAVCENLA